MTDRIFLVTGESTLEPLDASPYENEDIFQELVERYPDLLAGEQMNPSAPRRWLLVKREMGIPDQESGSNRWSLDHLFLDQEGIPTLVEIKRAEDTRIRREVVGQVLDYAANAVLHWSIDVIRTSYEKTATGSGLEPRQHLLDFLQKDELEIASEDEDPTSEFWAKVKTNLEAGKIRLVFVADEIPTELENIVSFLNRQMDPCEALAVEMKQYVGKDVKTIAPRVLGQTPESRARKSARATGETRDWDEAGFFNFLQEKQDVEEIALARRIIDHVRPHVDEFHWGSESVYPKCDAFINAPDMWNLLGIWRNGGVAMRFKDIKGIAPFDQADAREELRARFGMISEKPMREDFMDDRVYRVTSLKSILSNKSEGKYLETIDWILERIRSHAG